MITITYLAWFLLWAWHPRQQHAELAAGSVDLPWVPTTKRQQLISCQSVSDTCQNDEQTQPFLFSPCQRQLTQIPAQPTFTLTKAAGSTAYICCSTLWRRRCSHPLTTTFSATCQGRCNCFPSLLQRTNWWTIRVFGPCCNNLTASFQRQKALVAHIAGLLTPLLANFLWKLEIIIKNSLSTSPSS